MSEPGRKKAELEEKLRAYVGTNEGRPIAGPDLVNEPMIRHWCQAMGDENPAYLDPEVAQQTPHEGLVAPPTMLQAWSLPGYPMSDRAQLPPNRQIELHALLDSHGYTGVVATNCEQEYHRYLRPGYRVTSETRFESISEEKATALGVGYFIVTRTTFTDQNGDEVGWMTFRVLKFKPAAQPAAAEPEAAPPSRPLRIRAPRAHDTGGGWEGVDEEKLLIQRCSECGRLRHPPRPMCPGCQSTKWEALESTGKGTVYSYTILHHPPIPGYEFPLPVALVDLEEGTRLVANVAGCKPEDVHIGMKVECRIEQADEGMKLPFFYPAK